MLYAALFLTLLLLLFLLSRTLHKELGRVFYKLTGSKKWTVYLLSFLFFPGTLIHELSHYLMSTILFVPTGKMNLIPKVEGDHVTLGSVEVGKTDILRRLLIGTAPFLIGTTLLIITLILAERFAVWQTFGYLLLVVYVLFEIGNTMFSSRKDMEGAITIFLLFFGVGLALYFLGFKLFDSLQVLLSGEDLTNTFQKGSLYLLIPLGINITTITLLRLTHKIGR